MEGILRRFSTSSSRGGVEGRPGFLPGQGSLQRTGEQIIDTPVRGRGVFRSLQGSPPRQGSSKRTAEQIADIPVPRCLAAWTFSRSSSGSSPGGFGGRAGTKGFSHFSPDPAVYKVTNLPLRSTWSAT